MPSHAYVEPRVAESLADVFESHPVGSEDFVDELGIGCLVFGIWG